MASTVRDADQTAPQQNPGYSQDDTPASLKQKISLDEAIEAQPHLLDPIAALNDPDYDAKVKQLRKRLDMTFMPVLAVLYFHNYLDRNNIAYVDRSASCPETFEAAF